VQLGDIIAHNMPDTKNELIKRLDQLMGQSLIDPKVSKRFLGPETRQETLEEFDFNKNEIKIIMNLNKFETIEGFGRKAYEAFGISSDMGKERK
jgi:hypothetical protein